MAFFEINLGFVSEQLIHGLVRRR